MKVYMTKLFQNGGSKAVRIPAEIRPAVDDLFIWADAQGRLILSDTPPKPSPSEFLSWATALPPVSPEEEKFLTRDQPLDDFAGPFDQVIDRSR